MESKKSISEKAFTPEEVRQQKLIIDYQYYKSTQIFDPVSRLCQSIKGCNLKELANELGLRNYQHRE